MNYEKEFEKAFKQLNKSKQLLKDFEEQYPDQDTSNLKNQLDDLETNFNHLKPLKLKTDWDFVQKNYNDYCETFSPAYLSGCMWYKFIKNYESGHGDFKKAYMRTKMEDHYSKYKEMYSNGITLMSMFMLA